MAGVDPPQGVGQWDRGAGGASGGGVWAAGGHVGVLEAGADRVVEARKAFARGPELVPSEGPVPGAALGFAQR